MTQAALYARVSTDLQEKEQTIRSQLEALRKYAQDKGYDVVAEYKDEGYSGATLERPCLDQLRDALRCGEFDMVLFHSPDRLARKALYQELILEELEKAGVKAEFLDHPVDDTPEGKMLLGMQGLFAEYERAKIAERTRRGRLHKARAGILQGGRAPYGYLYIKRDGDRPGSLVIKDEEAEVVQTVYHWLLEEHLSIRRIALRLMESGVAAPWGGSIWRSSAVGRILSYEIYAGTGYYNKRQKAVPQRYQTPKPYRKDAKSSFRSRPREEWLPFPPPAIVDRETWERAQAQLRQNALHSPRNNKRFQYLLKGLVRCGSCDRPLTGQSQNGRSYYRHNRGETPWLQEPCVQKRGYDRDTLEPLVWEAMADALQSPDVLAQEYQRRRLQSEVPDYLETQEKRVDLVLRRVKVQEGRLIDAYKNEAIELPQLKEEMGKLRPGGKGWKGIGGNLSICGKSTSERRMPSCALKPSASGCLRGLRT